MAEAEDPDELRSKRKVVTSLLPYAVWLERDGQPEVLDVLLHTARASRMLGFMWYRISRFVDTLLSEASPRAIVLTSPHLPWDWLTYRVDLVQQWAAAIYVVPYTEDVARCVVDTLLQIASGGWPLPHITVDVWSWLKTQPPLPPVCLGRYFGTYPHVIKAVRELEDVEILKSYLLLSWSEWGTLRSEGFDEMCATIREDFCGLGMSSHRTDLIKRLDHILWQLDRGLEYLRQHNPNLHKGFQQAGRHQYRKLREILLETATEAIGCMSDPMSTRLPAY